MRYGSLVSLLPVVLLTGCNALFGIQQLTPGAVDAAVDAGILGFDAPDEERDSFVADHQEDRKTTSDEAASDAGEPCTLGSQCEDTFVCDPTMRRCVSEECTDISGSCGDDEICVLQYHKTTAGACYTACPPFVSGGCASDEVCIPVSTDGSEGACFPVGTLAVGDPCVVSDVQSNCVQGTQCIDTTVSGWQCTPLCDYWEPKLNCPAPTLCGPMNSCLEPDTGDSAAIGSLCSVGALLMQVCGPDGRRFAGACVDEGGSRLECLQACRTDTTPANKDCPAGQACAIYSGLPLYIGLCEAT